MINFFNTYNEDAAALMPNPRGPEPSLVDDEETTLLEAAGAGIMRGAADIAGAVTLAAGGLYGFGEEDRKKQDKIFKFYDEVIRPARDYWTPDPESTSMAGQAVGFISSLAVPLMLGPGGAEAALIGSTTFSTGADLVDEGVDPLTATGLSVLNAAATGLMVKLPASGKKFFSKETAALIGLNPVIGGVHTAAEKKVLESRGYDELAKSFNPYDPVARTLDLVLGGVFGGMAHYGRVREALPVQLNDAVDVASLAQKTAKNNPLEGPKNISKHTEALNKAVEDVAEGKPVDVAPVIGDLKPEDLKAAGIDAETEKVRKAVNTEIKKAVQDVADNDLRQQGFTIEETETAKLVDVPSSNKIEKATKVVSELPEYSTPDLFVKENIGLEEAKRIGREYYSTLEQTPLHSPAFHDQEVLFNENGWTYLTDREYANKKSTGKLLSDGDIIRRVKLLPKAKEIIQKTPYADEVRNEQNGSKRYSLLGRFSDGSVVRVIVEEASRDGRTFLSVFDLEDVSKKLRKAALPGQSPEIADFGVGKEPSAKPVVPVESTIKQSSEKVNPQKAAPKGKKRRPSSETDSLADFVRNSGGISTEKEFLKGEVKDRFSIREGYNLVNNKTGSSLDRMTEYAHEEGYFRDRPDISEFLDALRKDVDSKMAGKKGAVWSLKKQNWDDVWEDEFQAEMERMLLEHGDMEIYAGTDADGAPVAMNARDLIDDARVDVAKAESMQDLYNMAAGCLRRS